MHGNEAQMTSKNLIDPVLLKLFNNEPPSVDINSENLAQLHQIFIGQAKMFRDVAVPYVPDAGRSMRRRVRRYLPG